MPTTEIKCSHRHTIKSHPRCFNEDGTLKVKTKTPKILLFDIESSPMSVFVWGLYKQRISPDNVINDWFVNTWSAKWLFDSEIMSDSLTPSEAIRQDDRRIVKNIWKLLDEADIIIAHNARGFDVGKLNTRFLYYGMNPPSHYQVIDTLSVLRKYFKISSSSLDYATQFLGLSPKGHPSFGLWKRCYVGDPDALQSMVEYNKNDVEILEELYVKIRPWITNHPNLSLYVDTDEAVCPNCGSLNLMWKGSYVTSLGSYDAFRCECGAVGRSKSSNLSKDKIVLRG